MTDTVMVKRLAPWGIAPDGSEVEVFQIGNDVLQLELASYGARVVALSAPDREGASANVVLGHAALAPYLADKAFLGCSVGRFANRIAKGQFRLEGETYQLDVNDGPNTLHGGSGGLAHRNWVGRPLPDGIEFTITSPDGDQGFPGTLTVTSRYRLEGNQITLEYEATTDKTTVVNLTNHAYFNLSGEGSPTALDHVLQLEASAFLPIDTTAIPLGEPAPVVGSPFDFTEPHTLGERIHEGDEQLSNAGGYDHNFVLRRSGLGLQPAATLVHPGSGRRLEVATTEPGLQLYSGNYLDGTVVGRSGLPYSWRSAICLETQHWPDSPNRPSYPSTVLRPEEVFRSATVWTFSTV